jgi:hypothetical protein
MATTHKLEIIKYNKNKKTRTQWQHNKERMV